MGAIVGVKEMATMLFSKIAMLSDWPFQFLEVFARHSWCAIYINQGKLPCTEGVHNW